jgi:hypothetical protein
LSLSWREECIFKTNEKQKERCSSSFVKDAKKLLAKMHFLQSCDEATFLTCSLSFRNTALNICQVAHQYFGFMQDARSPPNHKLFSRNSESLLAT